MKNRILIIILILIGLSLLSYYFWNLPKGIDSINNCNLDSDCVIVGGFCGGAVAINTQYRDNWSEQVKDWDTKNPNINCAPIAPFNYFKAVCAANKCVAKSIK